MENIIVIPKFLGGSIMRDEYDFSNAKRNPYAKKIKKQITINIDEVRIDQTQSAS